MRQSPTKRQCRHCYFSRPIADALHCVRNCPSLDLKTGLARWPIVKDNDICGGFRFADQNHIDADHWPKNDLPIYTDRFGDYCKIPLGKERFAKVDPEDYIWLSQFKWFCQTGAGKKSYAARYGPRKENGRQKAILMHRLLAGTPPTLVCDHINGDGLDNRKNNLRNCTKQQNNFNARPHRNSTSRFKGVYWQKGARKWNAVIHLDGKRIHLGYFDDEVEAAKAYDQKAKELFGDFGALNFPTKSKSKS